MEAIILQTEEKGYLIKNIDTEFVSTYISQNLFYVGDVVSIGVLDKHFEGNNLIIKGKARKLNDTSFLFDECLKCKEPYNEESKPLRFTCWKSLQKETKVRKKKKIELEPEETKRSFQKSETGNDIEKFHQDFRKKYPADIRANDGHWVRSKAEKIIDDYLYRNKIVHSYERKIPNHKVYCDFYIPGFKIWIEYWGLDDPEYIEQREKKIQIYKEQEYYDKLIEFTEDDMDALDEKLGDRLQGLGVDKELE